MSTVLVGSATSKLHVTQGEFVWHVEQLEAQLHEGGDSTISPTFMAAGLQWQLKLSLIVWANNADFSCSLICKNKAPRVRSMVTTSPSSSNVLDERPLVNYKAIGDSSFVFSISRNDVRNRLDYKATGCLTLYLKVRVYSDKPEAFAASGVPRRLSPTVIDDLKSCLEASADADASLRTQGSLVPVHTFMLKVRSPVFKKMLESKMEESLTRVIDLPEPEVVVRAFVRFLYSDETGDCDNDAICHLLKLGHRYEVTALTQHCEARLESSLKDDLSPDTAIELLMLADELAMQGFKQKVLRFLVESGKLAEAQSGEPWGRLASARPHLSVEIVSALVPSKPAAPPAKQAGKKRKAAAAA
eukprot:TRINITY_DN35053_c0_g1_i1.p1 TRINITY_DN35053_c0_g1~~TRINITY_DN35053_c0_g1_i1.p1  ORF type:complete len:358 (+),score=71.17 TRINITY_DN35053_c0_g1_i1:189-1262(+)